MNQEDTEVEERIIKLLGELQNVSARDPQVASHGLAVFLSQAESLYDELISNKQPESTRQINRLIGWIYPLQTILQRKERKTMMTTLVSFLITITLILGGTGATVYAAQGSLPNDLLYPVKLLSEELQQQLTFQDQNQLRLALKFADQRVVEIEALKSEQRFMSAEVAARLEQQVEFALQLAARMEPTAMHQALEQIRATLRQQEQTMAQLEATQPNYPLLVQVRLRLREQLRLVEVGLTDPLVFQEQVRLRQQTRQEFQQGVPEEPPASNYGGNDPVQGQPVVEPAQNGNNSGPGAQASPGSGNGSGVQPTQEPAITPVPGLIATSQPPIPDTSGSNGSGPNQPNQPAAPGNGGAGNSGGTGGNGGSGESNGSGGGDDSSQGQPYQYQSTGSGQSTNSSNSDSGGSGGRP